MTDPVVLCECFARDGLQHETAFIATAHKRALIEQFATIGFQRVEATSYSNPKVVPQFADASELLQALERRPGVFYKATCANLKAIERARADVAAGAGVNEISLLLSASESHTQRNLRTSRAEQWSNVARMIEAAGEGFRMVGTISVAFGCPFEGRVDPGIVLADARRLVQSGVRHVALGDTTGMATPHSARELFGRLLRDVPGIVPIAHFHDTRGTALANCLAAYEAGVRYFDSAFGGVGGHPAKVQYGEGYTGNVCTEDLVHLFESLGIATGIDIDGLMRASVQCEEALGRMLHSRVARSGVSALLPKAAHA